MDPQATLEPGDETSSGFGIVRDVIFAPNRAFRAIDRTNGWIPAYLVVTACTLGALALYAPAYTNVLLAQGALSPDTRGESLLQMHQAASAQILLEALTLILGTPFGWAVMAIAFATTAMVCGKPARFATYFSLSANCAIPSALGQLAMGLFLRSHDPTTFHTISDMNRAFPLSLAALKPTGSETEITFLAYWDVFQVWSLLLVGFGFSAIAKINSLGALTLSAGLCLIFALLSAIGQNAAT
jgi:hypothetical protein